MVKNKYKAAVIGLGYAGALVDSMIPRYSFRNPYSHASTYSYMEETDLVAGANRGEERRNEFSRRFGVKAYKDWRHMIETEKPDILSIAVPTPIKFEVIKFAVEFGVKGIYCEKTLATSLEEADLIADVLRTSHVAFNWGAERRYHDGFGKLREAISCGDIGVPQFAAVYGFSDLMKHGAHHFDLVSFLLGDPQPRWVDGSLVEHGSPLDPGSSRQSPYLGLDLSKGIPLPLPTYDPSSNRFLPPPGRDIAEPMVQFARVGYVGGMEAIFQPLVGRRDIEVIGDGGRAFVWGSSDSDFRVWSSSGGDSSFKETSISPSGEGPSVCIVKEIIREIETGQRTTGNIDVAMQVMEAQFGVAASHIKSGSRVLLPLEDRTLHIPSH